MNFAASTSPLQTISHYIHKYFLWLLVSSYLLAGFVPGPALAIRAVSLGSLNFFGQETRVALPMLMLALLLFNAGLGVRLAELKNLVRSPKILAGGLAVNLLVPLVFIFICSRFLLLYHNQDEAQQLIVGLALIAAMPIAGSSTAWAQNANGDLSLSLGLVLFSTFLSPLTTYFSFDAVERMTTGPHVQTLESLERSGSSFLLLGCVLFPSVAGIATRALIGGDRSDRLKPLLKLINCVNLLLLNYSNAGVSLPHVFANPDFPLYAVMLVSVIILCGGAFASGWILARLLGASSGQRLSLMFGLGMNNNGTSLVLASLTLSHYPRVLLPIILYNLIQHLIAAYVDRNWGHQPRLISAP